MALQVFFNFLKSHKSLLEDEIANNFIWEVYNRQKNLQNPLHQQSGPQSQS